MSALKVLYLPGFSLEEKLKKADETIIPEITKPFLNSGVNGFWTPPSKEPPLDKDGTLRKIAW